MSNQKDLPYGLGDRDFLDVIKKALPSFVKVIEHDGDLYGQRGFMTFYINDEDFLRCPQDRTLEEFKEDCEEYEEGL
jgi:hypothetical protein|tara:strand:+ start:138 stop:368 length:231 start_codon:yes stop_codon:yes gene_type:complete